MKSKKQIILLSIVICFFAISTIITDSLQTLRIHQLQAEVYALASLQNQEIKELKNIERWNDAQDPMPDKLIIQKASWYDYRLGDQTWSKQHRTAASRDYPRGTMLKITNVKNNRSVSVLVNDYGPAKQTGRQIDLSSYAFAQIENPRLGLADVSIERVR